jgi:hypothetical protein
MAKCFDAHRPPVLALNHRSSSCSCLCHLPQTCQFYSPHTACKFQLSQPRKWQQRGGSAGVCACTFVGLSSPRSQLCDRHGGMQRGCDLLSRTVSPACQDLDLQAAGARRQARPVPSLVLRRSACTFFEGTGGKAAWRDAHPKATPADAIESFRCRYTAACVARPAAAP